MATEKQEKALNKMLENGGIASRAMLDAGYSLATAKTPQKLTGSLGFVELCEERGLTDNFLIDALIEDIKAKPGNRTAELALALKIKGRVLKQLDITSKYEPITSITYITPERKEEIDKALDEVMSAPD